MVYNPFLLGDGCYTGLTAANREDDMRYTHEAETFTRQDGMPVDYVPNEHRIVRVAPDSWRRMLDFRCVGIAPGTEAESDGTHTVRVRNLYDPSINDVVPVSHFRREREGTRAAKVTAPRELTEAERFLPSAVEILGQYN